ncbi:hypothetical protein phiAS5_ORF0160 [Aeromonas phage phiAS5]|uniref:Uncharacterized protein n=1 Tax=Aeromonas phage phiAS5 TaxID=879630 RepID=E1A2Q7_9CAUD|nr:hypothetical protein phiAS5_ORF0160 [Aeromonas phage phiAS5]ADM80003.1 hypothetical protein phiAS5_ORF0160 [Aeromonas phage phiAS5]BES53226.1 hypothetical protein [Aeromonas phage phiWae14]
MASNVEILQAVPAAGKTKAILTHVRKNKKPCIIASISCQLSQQSYDFYNNITGENDSIIIDSDHVSRSKSVSDVISESIGKNRVLFITHAALLAYPDYDDMKGYELYIDEVPDLVQLNQLKFTDNLDFIGKFCNIDEGKMSLKEECRENLNKIATDGLYGHDVVSSSVFSLARSLLQGIPVILKDNVVYFIDDSTTQKWHVFDRITIACANFRETFTGVILKEFCGWSFKTSPLMKKLDFIQYPNSSRVEIIPLYNGIWSRYSADKDVDGESVYNKVKDTVYDLVGMTPFIYTTNSYRAALKVGHRVAYNPHGLNNYMSHTTAVALFSYNPMPWQIELLKCLSECHKMDANKLIDAFLVSKYLEPVFQLCLRTDIRNQHSTWKVSLLVPDLRAAEYLKSRYLLESKIDTSHMVSGPARKERKQETAPRKKRVTFANLFDFTKAEQGKFYRWCRTLDYKLDAIQPEHVKLVSEWINKSRSL